jgi:hypothetical protein
MSLVYQPTGLRLAGARSSEPWHGATTIYPLTSNNTVALAVGDPVALVAGSIVPVTANPASGTVSANTPIGVVMGFEYTDNVNRRYFVCSQILVANAITSALYTNVQVLVADAPNERFVIQANGPITAADLGLNIDMGGFNADDLVNRTSRVFAVAADVATTATLPLRIVGFDKDPSNTPGDAFTKIWVSWNAGVQGFAQAGTH